MQIRRWSPPATDAALALAFAAAAQVELRFPVEQSDIHGGYVGNVVLALATTLPLAWRRRAPLPALLAVFAAYLVDAAFQQPTNLTYGGGVPLVVLCYSLGRHEAARWALTGLLAGSGWLALLAWRSPTLRAPDELVFDVVLFAGSWAFGRALGHALDRERSAARRAAMLAADQERHQRELLAHERARIARELHDVIAHSVSIMVVQAGAAARVLDSDQESARGALAAIRSTGKDTVGELRRLLGVLRADDPRLTVDPRQGLAALGDLLTQVRAAGLTVDLVGADAARSLPDGVDQAAYRVVQEALTNVLKHSDARHARVCVSRHEGMLEVCVFDDGTEPGQPIVPGHGLVGMRERTHLYGGDLEAGYDERSGFRVRATLAVPADDSEAAIGSALGAPAAQ